MRITPCFSVERYRAIGLCLNLNLNLCLSLLSLLLFAEPALADPTWRTPSGALITTGMSKAEVMAHAGPPDFAENLSCEGSTQIKTSAWYYLVGQSPNREAVTLTFEGTRLIGIETQLVR